MKPGGCNGRIVTLIVQVKDLYGATSVCGGTSHPENVYPCPTAEVLPYPDGEAMLLEDLRSAKESIAGGSNAVSSSELLAQTMAIKTAFGDDCGVSVSFAFICMACWPIYCNVRPVPASDLSLLLYSRFLVLF